MAMSVTSVSRKRMCDMVDVDRTFEAVGADLFQVLTSTHPSLDTLQRCNQSLQNIVKVSESHQRQMLDTQAALVLEANHLEETSRRCKRDEASQREELKAKKNTQSQKEEDLKRARALRDENQQRYESRQSELRKADEERDGQYAKGLLWGLLPIVGTAIGIATVINADKKIQQADLCVEASREDLKRKESMLRDITDDVDKIISSIVKSDRELQSLKSKQMSASDALSTITQQYQTSCHNTEKVKFIFYTMAGYQEAVGSVLKFDLPKSLLSKVCEPLRHLLATQLSHAAQYRPQLAREAIGDGLQQLWLQTEILQNPSDRSEPMSAICPRNPTTMSDIQLVLTQFCGWEELLVPLPKLHTVLGQLLVRSNDADFSLEDAMPAGGFKHLKHPSSFRSNLLQIVNLGWDALVECKKSMNKMYMLAKMLSVLLNGLSDSLESDTIHNLSDLVACTKHMMEECGTEASNMERRFHGIISMMMELEGCTTTKRGRKEDDCKDWSSKHSAEQFRHDNTEERRRQLASEIEKVLMSISESEEKLLENIQVPTIMEDIGRGLLTVMGGVKTKAQKFSRIFKNQPSCTEEVMDSLSNVVSEMEEYVAKGDAKDITLKRDIKRDAVTRTHTNLGYIEKDIKKTNKTELTERMKTACNTGKTICENIKAYIKMMEQSESESSSIATTIIQLGIDLTKMKKDLDEESRQVAEKEEKEHQEKHSKEQSTQESYTDKTKLKETAYRQQLEAKLKRYDQLKEKYSKYQEQLEENASEIGKLKFQSSDDEATLKYLKTSIKEMAGIREQWGLLIDLFQQMSNVVECRMAQGLKKIVEMSGSRGAKTSLLVKAGLTSEINKMTEICDFVAYVAWNYSLVSDKILMPQANVLQRLVMQKGATQADDISSLATKGLQAQDDIRDLLNDEKMKLQMEFVQSKGKLINKAENTDIEIEDFC